MHLILEHKQFFVCAIYMHTFPVTYLCLKPYKLCSDVVFIMKLAYKLLVQQEDYKER